MVLIGGGVIGMELGMVYQKLGSKVTVVEMLPQMLTGVDPGHGPRRRERLKKTGGKVMTEAKAEKVEKKGAQGHASIAQGREDREVEADKVLDGRRLQAEQPEPRPRAGRRQDRPARTHHGRTSGCDTNVQGVYAIGDLIGPPYLAHKATKEGEIAAEVIAGHKAAVDWRAMPAAIFTEPEIATVGLSETEAKKTGREIKIGKFPFSASGRAMAVRHTDGFIKTIIDADTHEVLGVGIVGPEASDLDQRSGARHRDVRVRGGRPPHHPPAPHPG